MFFEIGIILRLDGHKRVKFFVVNKALTNRDYTKTMLRMAETTDTF